MSTIPSTKLAKRRIAEIDPELKDVLRRCALFYRKAGFSESQLVAEWAAALKWSRNKSNRVRIFRAGATDQYRHICNRWMRDPRYLLRTGKPKPLPLIGPDSIASLVRAVGGNLVPQLTVIALKKIGAIRQVRHNLFRLTAAHFYSRAHNYVAYEPFSQFLQHAVVAATKPVFPAKTDKYSHWWTVTTKNLSEKELERFISSAQRRMRPAMEDIDESVVPFDARNIARKNSTTRNIAGVGMFTFVTKPGGLK